MGFAETVLLGAIAGFTIYIGLPIGRFHSVDNRVRVALAMFSVGILAFIFMDVTNHGEAIIASALASFKAADRRRQPRGRAQRVRANAVLERGS